MVTFASCFVDTIRDHWKQTCGKKKVVFGGQLSAVDLWELKAANPNSGSAVIFSWGLERMQLMS